ncbi:MAG: hypothetical protein KDD11_21405, partial [Acidobacteria bacterium]|nr:hypothetical protein [Acidobacteriota bacterium]
YQGRLLENTTGAGPVTGSVDIVFSIWSDLTDGTELWSESWSNVQLSSGVFSVLLGSNGSPLDPAEFQNDPTLFVQLEIDGETLSPRQQLGSVPFAIVDERKNELQDLTFDGTNLGLTQSGVTVDLASSDNQDLSLSGNTLSLENDPTPVDLSSYLDNTDDQQLGLAGETLSLTNGGSVDLSTVLQNKLIVFVTSVGHDGNFGGLAGADAFCQSLADAVSLGGTFKAWLSDSTTSPADRFAHRSESYV